MIRFLHGLLLTGLAASSVAAAADVPTADGQPQCQLSTKLPPHLASWTKPIPMKAAGDSRGLARAVLIEGQAVALILRPTPKVDYLLRPERPGGSVSFGGLLRFNVEQEGVWRVALGSGAWVDVVSDGKAAVSVAHGHGPACSGIRKMVDYRLAPGNYTLQVAANGGEALTLLVTRLP